MKVGISKVLSTKVPSTIGTLIAGGLITNGIHDLTTIATEVVAGPNKKKSPLEVENELLKKEILSLKEEVASLSEPSIGGNIDSMICTVQNSVKSWIEWAGRKEQPKLEKIPVAAPKRTESPPLQENLEETLCFSLIPENSSFGFRVIYLFFGLYVIYYPVVNDLINKAFYKK